MTLKLFALLSCLFITCLLINMSIQQEEPFNANRFME